MSSEESKEEEAIKVVYRPRIMEWRCNMDGALQMIDKEHRRLAMTQAPRGARPVPRKWSVTNSISTRDPVCGLPPCLYNQAWLGQKLDLYVKQTLKLSERQFKWLDLTVV